MEKLPTTKKIIKSIETQAKMIGMDIETLFKKSGLKVIQWKTWKNKVSCPNVRSLEALQSTIDSELRAKNK